MKMLMRGWGVVGCYNSMSCLRAIQGLVNFQLALIFKFDRVNDVNDICKTDSIWYNKSTAESNVKRFLQAILSNSRDNVSVENVAYQTEPGSWDITCANTSVTNVTNVAVLKVNLTTSLSSGKEDVKIRLNNFWHGGWDYSVLSSIIGNKSHWIACVQASDVMSATKEHGSLHPLDCEIITRDTSTSTVNPSISLNSNPSIIPEKTGPTSRFTSIADNQRTTVYTSLKHSSSQSQDGSSITGYTSWKQISSSASQSQDSSGITGYKSSSTVLYISQSQDSSGITGYKSSSTVLYSSQSQDSSGSTGYKSSSTVLYSSQSQDSSGSTGYKSSSTVLYSSRSQDSSGSRGYKSSSTVLYSSQIQDSSGSTGYKLSSTVHYSSQSQGSLVAYGISSLKSEEQKKDDSSNALAVGLGTGLCLLALLGTLVTLLYRYFSEKNKVSDFSGIYGFPPETPRQSDRSGKSTFRQNMA